MFNYNVVGLNGGSTFDRSTDYFELVRKVIGACDINKGKLHQIFINFPFKSKSLVNNCEHKFIIDDIITHISFVVGKSVGNFNLVVENTRRAN